MDDQRRLFLAIAFVALALSIGAAERLNGGPGDEVRSPDQEVLRVVLEHLSTYSGNDLPLSLSPDIPRTVVFTTSWPDHPSDFCPFSITAEGIVADLPESKRQAALEATQDATRREVRGPSTNAFLSASARVVVVGEGHDPSGRNHPEDQASYPLSAWPPGYSSVRDVAVVKLYFPEVFHPSYAIYVLSMSAKSWRVLAVRFVTLA